jgi:DNA-binding NarL/FixJ family response regulator
MFRLLICDDHPAIRTALRLLAREATAGDCEVTECASAEELLAVLEQDRPFDFVTLDLQLPGRSGLDVLADVKQMRPDLPVMVFSADESPERVTEALQAGASSYLVKTAPEQVLTDALRAAAAHRSALPRTYVREWNGARDWKSCRSPPASVKCCSACCAACRPSRSRARSASPTAPSRAIPSPCSAR